MNIIRRFLAKYVYQDWNIAIADIAEDLTPINIKWMKHNYNDRWFADPFILDETDENYIVLVEEYLHKTNLGRLARLTISKCDCTLLKNETILELPTHLSFPNPMKIDGKVFVYPENAQGGNTKYYSYGQKLVECGVLSELPLADPTVTKIGNKFFLFATLDEQCNGDTLCIYESEEPLKGYKKFQEITFKDNTARRAGNVFSWNGKLISPAQDCNGDYGKGISLQELTFVDGKINLTEIKRMYPLTKEYPEGFHTYNVYKDKVIIDGYRYGSKFLHDLYFKLRK